MALSQWDEQDLEDLKFMVGEGFIYKEIAQVLGKSLSTITNQIKIMGLVSPRKERQKGDEFFCLKCKQYKIKEDFHKNSNSPYGIRRDCKECHNKIVRDSYHNRHLKKLLAKEKAEERTKEEIEGSQIKQCTKCHETKNVEEFAWQKKNKKLNTMCKACMAKLNHEYRLKRLETKGY